MEFWGMFPYKKHPYAAWPKAYSRETVEEIISLAIDKLHITPLPCQNLTSHAGWSRIASRKHVVLDQRPDLADMWVPGGWCFATENPKTQEYLRDVMDIETHLFYIVLAINALALVQPKRIELNLLTSFLRPIFADLTPIFRERAQEWLCGAICSILLWILSPGSPTPLLQICYLRIFLSTFGLITISAIIGQMLISLSHADTKQFILPL